MNQLITSFKKDSNSDLKLIFMKKFFNLAILGFIIFASCKSKPKVDNKSAIQFITNGLNLPIEKYGIFKSGDYQTGESYKDDGYIDNPNTFIRRLQMPGEIYLRDNGYRDISVRIEKTYIGPNNFGLPEYINEGPMVINFKFTDMVEPYLDSLDDNSEALTKLRTTEINFGNLTSLRQLNENEYEVEFSLNVVNTPFGEAIKQGKAWYKSGKFINPSQFQKLKVKILKYENGWNIATEDLERLKEQL